MATEVILPKLGFSMNEGNLAELADLDLAILAEVNRGPRCQAA